MQNFSKEVLGVFKKPEKSERWSPLLSTWIDQYERKLIAIAYSILNDDQLARDCVQETFIKAGLNAYKLENKNRVSSWLARIVVNECISKIRRHRREALSEDIDRQAYEETYPSDQDSDIYHMVRKLPENLMVPVVLYYYHDYSLAEIASMLRLNEATCRVRLHRARTKLREMMEGEGNE